MYIYNYTLLYFMRMYYAALDMHQFAGLASVHSQLFPAKKLDQLRRKNTHQPKRPLL